MTNCTKICTSKEKESWERESELGKKTKKEGESRSEFQFGFMKILLLTENINSVWEEGLNWSFYKCLGCVWHYSKPQGSLLNFTLIIIIWINIICYVYILFRCISMFIFIFNFIWIITTPTKNGFLSNLYK